MMLVWETRIWRWDLLVVCILAQMSKEYEHMFWWSSDEVDVDDDYEARLRRCLE